MLPNTSMNHLTNLISTSPAISDKCCYPPANLLTLYYGDNNEQLQNQQTYQPKMTSAAHFLNRYSPYPLSHGDINGNNLRLPEVGNENENL